MKSPPSTTATATKPSKCRSTLVLLFFFFLLYTILLISARTLLKPRASLYPDFFPQISISSDSAPSPIYPSPPPPEPEPKHSNSETGNGGNPVPVTTVASSAEGGSVNGDSLGEAEEDPVPVTLASSAERGSADPRIEALAKCDLYSGTWVRDEAYPIYGAGSCPYVDEAFDCQSNGRADRGYLAWRWKPHACDLPKFNATDFLMRLRGKKMMLIGDSMNRNQFESILCLLREGLQNKSAMYEVRGHKITKGRGYYVFNFEEYNCTVDFVRSHYLVREGVRVNGQGNTNPTLSIDRIDKSSPRWKRADILVFNTGHWWAHGKTSRGKNYFREGDYVYPKFDGVEAYIRSLKTWSNWIDKNANPEKQIVIYRGYSSAHFRGGDWDSGGSCNGETEPAFSGAILDSYPLKMKIVEETIKSMRVPVKLLNITGLTNFRKDGHPSIFGRSSPVSKRRQDCSHWCLPGVPDTWNELIYATLLVHQTKSI